MTETIDRTKIKSMDSYLRAYGALLGKKAIDSLDPLHLPDRDGVPDFSYVTEHNPLRTPLPPQQHVIAASVKMLDSARNGWCVGEMGTGKTIIGILTVHEHAGGEAYRAMVLCPDHLLPVWEDEIRSTLPDVDVVRFENWKGLLPFLDTGTHQRKTIAAEARSTAPKKYPVSTGVDTFEDVEETIPESSGKLTKVIRKWVKPIRPTWILLGRNQAKYKPEFYGVGEKHRGFNGQEIEGRCSRMYAVGKVDKLDDEGKPVFDKNGIVVQVKVMDRAVKCPKCDTIIRGAKGIPASIAAIAKTQHECEGNYLVGVPKPDDNASHGRDLLPGGPEYAPKVGKIVSHRGSQYQVVACKEKLWSYNRTPYRYPPACIIQRKLRGFFSHLVIDEVHEQKSDESAQSMACGKLMGVSKHIVALTGTLIGGYAKHLFPLLVRMSPGSIREEGFEWAKDLAWSQRYGRVDRVVTTKQEAGTVSVGRKQSSMRKARKGKSEEKQYVRPGVMPTLYGKHMMGNSVFITLSEMDDELPNMFEYVGGGMSPKPGREEFNDPKLTEAEADEQFEDATYIHDREKAGYFDTACDMDEDLRTEYRRIEGKLEAANRELLIKGSMKLLGTTLWTLLDYPDRPYGWDHPMHAKGDDTEGLNGAPGLLGQSFLKNFDHKFDAKSETLHLTRNGADGSKESDVIPLKKVGGIYWLDVTFDGESIKSLAYDTGASAISIPFGMANALGLKPKKGDESIIAQIADGSGVPARATTIGSVSVGKFTVKDVQAIVMPSTLGHTVGYYDIPRDFTEKNWRGIVTPADLGAVMVRPKEKKLIDICLKEKSEGRQSWVYVQMTGKRNIQPRLKRLLENAGLKACILRSTDVKPQDRKDWIDRNGTDYDVIISNPTLVATGLTLFSKQDGGHNFPTLIFYQTGYNLFTLRQASRRAWRIGQPKECRVYYLYYKETMQHRAMNLMSRKMAAAAALDGEFSTEGLIGMSDEDNAQMALARTLKSKISDDDTQRSWSKSKVKVSARKKAAPGEAIKALTTAPVVLDALDDLPDEVQLVAQTIIDHAPKAAPKPAGPAIEFDSFDDEDDDDFDLQPLTREQLALMFANVAASQVA